MKKSHFLHLFKYLIAFSLLYWLVQKGALDFKALKFIMEPIFLVPALGLLMAQLLMNHFRWYLLLRIKKFQVSYWSSLPFTFMGIFFNFAMPGAVGGDVIKSIYIGKQNGGRQMSALSTALVDRMVGLGTMLLIALVAALINLNLVMANPILSSFFYTLLLCAFVGFSFLLIMLTNLYHKVTFLKRLENGNGKISQFIHKVFSAFQEIRDDKRILLVAGVLSIVSQFCVIAFFVVVGNALSEDLSVSAYFFAVCLGTIAAALLISPGGIGVGQVTVMYFLELFTGIEGLQVGTVGVTAMQVIYFVYGIYGAYYFTTTGKKQVELPT